MRLYTNQNHDHHHCCHIMTMCAKCNPFNSFINSFLIKNRFILVRVMVDPESIMGTLDLRQEYMLKGMKPIGWYASASWYVFGQWWGWGYDTETEHAKLYTDTNPNTNFRIESNPSQPLYRGMVPKWHHS